MKRAAIVASILICAVAVAFPLGGRASSDNEAAIPSASARQCYEIGVLRSRQHACRSSDGIRKSYASRAMVRKRLTLDCSAP